jgi:hypothetical protein
MRIRLVNLCAFCVSFCEKQGELRTSKILLNILADRTLTMRIAGRSSMTGNASGIAVGVQGVTA